LCGWRNPTPFRFCGACGATLDRSGPQARQLAEERRWASVLFADLSGFTRFSERRDPEDVRTVVDRCLNELGRIVDRFGGFVARVIGDEVMAIFGAPVAHEDDAERAVRAALEMQRSMTEHADDFGGLRLRVGVNSGETLFAPLGTGDARRFTVTGDVANTGARLQAAAPEGGVLVGEATYLATRGGVRYEAVGLLELKGRQAPVSAWLAMDAAPVPTRRPLSDTPMLGRDAELELLDRIWDRVVAERRPHLITVLGPPGIGKSRLGREFLAHVEARGGRVLVSRSLSYGENAGYGVFARQLKALAGIYETDPIPEAREKLARTVGALLPGGSADELTAHLAVLTGLSAEDAVPDRPVLLYSARRLVEALAAERPSALVFEDLQWADPSLLDLLEMLASRIRGQPVLLLALARPELLDARPSWGGGLDAHVALSLDALAEADARNLAAGLLDRLGHPPAGVDQLVEIADGNPLFLEELAASVAERTTVSKQDLPHTIKALIIARLDGLPPVARSTLLNAAVIGRIFWRRPLEQLGGDGELAEALDLLEARDFVRRQPSSRAQDDEQFAFRHVLIRETAYATLPKAVRRERHAAVARLLEAATADRAGMTASLLAYHWRQAGDPVRAVRWLLIAAEDAERAWAKREAAALYEQALELIGDGEGEAGRRRDLRLRRGMALVDGGDLPTAARELTALLPELAGRDLAEALLACSRATFWMMDTGRGRELAQRAVEITSGLGDEALSARAAGQLGFTLSTIETRTFDGIAEAKRALAAWKPGAYQAELAMLLGLMGGYHSWIGDYAGAVQYGRQGYEVGSKIRYVDGVLLAASHYGLGLVGLGRHEEALRLYQRVVASGKELELAPRFTARVVSMWAGALRELYDTEEARRLNAEAIDLAGRAAFPPPRVQAAIDLLFLDIIEERFDAAERAWPGLREQAEAMRGWHQWLMIGRLAEARAEIALGLGRPEAAAEAAVASIAHARRVGRLKYEVASRTVLGAALLTLGEPGEAVAELRRALAGAERLGHPPSLWRAAAELGAASYSVGDDHGAAAAYRSAQATIRSFAEALVPERQRRLFAAEPVRRILGIDG
jgi:class 3 adenylate cyclase/tetratricopeptide (TPR) repeat protein